MNVYTKMKARVLKTFKKSLNWAGIGEPMPSNKLLEYTIGDITVLLPDWHLLPELQRQHPTYDKLLPELARLVGGGEVIVDVGANCGDTLAGMVSSNSRCTYICIEPDEYFFEVLQKNLTWMQSRDKFLKIIPVKSLIGNRVQAAFLQGTGGTKYAIPSLTGNISSRSLDSILQAVDLKKVRLIKIDVDGYDFDVIDSASITIEQSAPILFFECACSTDEQTGGFKTTIASLASRGYSEWSVFDNFGGLVGRRLNTGVVLQLIDYVGRQNAGFATRTMYYLDILASRENDAPITSKAIDNFLALDR